MSPWDNGTSVASLYLLYLSVSLQLAQETYALKLRRGEGFGSSLCHQPWPASGLDPPPSCNFAPSPSSPAFPHPPPQNPAAQRELTMRCSHCSCHLWERPAPSDTSLPTSTIYLAALRNVSYEMLAAAVTWTACV